MALWSHMLPGPIHTCEMNKWLQWREKSQGTRLGSGLRLSAGILESKADDESTNGVMWRPMNLPGGHSELFGVT